MTEEYLITGDILTNGRFLSVSLRARYLFLAMILLADQEGRAFANSRTWKSQASLWGVADASDEDIVQAIQELHDAGLIVLYENSRLFLPGRFKHNCGRKWWKRSKHPLPSIDLLIQHPEYLSGLRLLTTKGRLYKRSKEARRYPELADDTPVMDGGDNTEILKDNRGEHGGNQGELTGNPGEVGIGVGVDVDVEKNKKAAAQTLITDSSQQSALPYETIITYLNEKAGTHYRQSGENSRKLIRARWNEGYRLDDFYKVIDNQVLEWLSTKFSKYLRPATLFGSKFESYLNSPPQEPDTTGDAYEPYVEDCNEYEQR